MNRVRGAVLILIATASFLTAARGEDSALRNAAARSSIARAAQKFAGEKQGHVAFMGGSITEMNGYRPMVSQWLTERFPETKFRFTDAGIASTCSTTGAFRLDRDVLSQGPVDLFLVEFAVNDDQDAEHARRDCIRGMEGIIRHLKQHNPQADVAIVYFCNERMIAQLQADQTPVSIAAHEAVAEHYGIASVNLANEVAQRITDKSLTWKTYGGTHPAPAGNRIAADMVIALLDSAWKRAAEAAAGQPAPRPAPLDEQSYEHGRFVDPATAKTDEHWRFAAPDWKNIPGQLRSRFAGTKLLCADAAGAELTLKFTGTAIGAYVLAGPDAGTVEASVDGGPPRTVDLYHRFSKGLHYPRTVMFDADLPAGEHTLRLRISESKNPASRGHAVRVLQFTAN